MPFRYGRKESAGKIGSNILQALEKKDSHRNLATLGVEFWGSGGAERSIEVMKENLYEGNERMNFVVTYCPE